MSSLVLSALPSLSAGGPAVLMLDIFLLKYQGYSPGEVTLSCTPPLPLPVLGVLPLPRLPDAGGGLEVTGLGGLPASPD